MAQSNAPLHSSRGGVGEKKEGVDCDNITVIKNEIDDDHQHSSTNGSSMIIDGSNNIIPIQKINTTSMEKNNNSPPSLESSADDGDAVMEDVAVTAASDKPPSGGEDHVEHDTAATTAIEDSVSNSSKNEGETVKNSLAATAAPDLQTPAAAALENQPSDGDGGVGGKGAAPVIVDDRKQKILSSIQHRRQLLAWVRESRIACEQSRNNISSGTKKSFVKAILDEHAKEVSDTHHPDGAAKTTTTAALSASTTPTTITDEIAEYKKIAKLANSAMALQRKKSTSTISENTAPRELRRGSNIGKRMSAAVSTLNNFGNVGGWASADSSISDAAAATAATNNKKNNSSSASAILPPNHVSSSSAGTAKNNTKSLSPNKAAFPPSVGKQLESGNTAQSSLSSKTASEKLQKKARKRASNIKKTGVAIGGADGSSTNISAALPKSATASTDNSGPYLTLSSSAIRLRDRRDELAQKLSDLLQKQHAMKSVGEKRKYDEMASSEKSPFTPNKLPKVVRAKVAQSSLTKLSSLSEMGTMKEAPRLPTRRMTQWDCILEEMRWMASDFIEERKWKVACGKTLSSSVKQHVEEQKSAARAAKGKSKTTPNKTDDQSAATETPSSSNAISAKSSKSVETKSGDRRKMSISDSNPMYVESSNEDIAHSKKVSKLLSLTVSDHWDVIRSKGAFPRTRDGYVAGYERFRKVKEELLGDTSGVQVKSCDNDHAVTPPAAPPIFQELEFDDISKKLQKAVEVRKSLKAKTNDALGKERALQKYRKSLICGVDLSNEQMKAVHFIDSVWAAREETGVAAVLGGNGLGRGRTIAGCATLWKNRLTGPQLVLCSPASLLRWKHELMKFEDMNVKVFGHGGWSIREDDIEVTSASTSDVLLCDYSSFIEMAGNKTDPSSPNFASLILDCRHPSVDSKNSGKHHVEIESPEWWNRLVLFIMRFSSMNRLVIEHPWNQLCPTDSHRVDKRGTLDCKIVAIKLAFMYNPAIFFSTHFSIGKRVISWAKRQGDFDDKSSTIPMLRSILTTSLRNIYDSSLACIGSDPQHPETIDDNESQNASKFSWEIRKCSLAPSQQSEYNQLCSNNMLFSCPDESAYSEIAKSLLLLRKICFHASIDDATRALLAPLIHANKDRIRSVDGTMIVRKSTQLSEPCLATSTQLLEKSSKMKELLDILTRECGHEVPNELTQNFVKDLDTNATRKKKKAKVIVLATLTEAQLLTSHFLSAIGLHHEVLVSFQTNGSSNLPTNTSAWAWSQNVISQFNDDSIPERGQPHRFLDILVASPFTLSSHNCGIGINSADFVISIDEDWSGRGEIHVASVLSKLRSSEEGAAKPLCKFVKIVSKGTCEDTFICKGNTVKADVAMSDATAEKLKSTKKTRKRGRSNSKKNQDEIEKTVAAPKIDSVEHQVCLLPSNICRMKNAMNGEGFLLPTATDEASSTRILGSNVLRHRNSNLSDVFGTQMGDESTQLFMPEADADKLIVSVSRPDQVQFPSALYQSEDNALRFVASPKAVLHSITLSSLHPAQLHIHPIDVLSNIDLSSAPIRCFASSLYTASSHQERTRQNVRLFQSDKADASSLKEETAAENAQTGENSEEREVDAENVDNFELLVYELPPDKLTEMDSTVSRKRKIGNGNVDSTSNVFSSFFELSDKATGFARDGHHGVEMSVYAPSFLPPLLDVARSIGVKSIPQDNGISSITTKQNADEVSSKLFTDSRRLDCSPSTIAAPVAPDATVATQSNEVSGGHYPVEMETNPYSFSAQSNDEYSDTTFCNRLLGCDAKGAISCQAWPSLNSMILLTEKKNENNTGDQEKKAKKTKNMHYPTTLAAQDALSIPYFRKEKLSRRALLATKKVKFDDAASMAGSVRLRSRLNDLVAGSATVSSSSQNSSAQHDSGKPSSGINLPIGVTEPESSSRLSKSLKDTSEPWIEKEDSLLKETVARYGMNWQLASHALSAVSSSIRSPSQCRHRWESLNDSQHTSNTEETTMRYKNDPGSNESESLIYNESSSNGDSKEGSTKKTPTHWIVSSSSSLSATTTNNRTEAKKEHIALIITKLKDVAKRRRVVSISLPGAIITDDKETTVRLAAIHPSHAEAVHIARSNLTYGVAPSRQEMWPLELLDYAEKQKKAAASEQNAHDPQRAPTSHQQQPTTSQSSRQPVAFPPQQPPPHPTQPHSAYYSAYDPYRRHQQQSKTAHDKPPPTKNGPS